MIIFLIFSAKWFCLFFFFFSSRRRHTRSLRDWSSDVCSSDLIGTLAVLGLAACRGAAPPLPPIPATAGPIMIKPRDPPPVHDGETVVDRVVAVVNSEIITMSELEEDVVLQLR